MLNIFATPYVIQSRKLRELQRPRWVSRQICYDISLWVALTFHHPVVEQIKLLPVDVTTQVANDTSDASDTSKVFIQFKALKGETIVTPKKYEKNIRETLVTLRGFKILRFRQVFVSLCPSATEARDLWKEPLGLVMGIAAALPPDLWVKADVQAALRSFWRRARERLHVPTPMTGTLPEPGCNGSMLSVLSVASRRRVFPAFTSPFFVEE